MKKISFKSFCKINLTLKVLKKLKNGYHEIETLITFCKPCDQITISKTKNISDKITFSGKFKKGIDERSNTITKTLHLLRKKNFLKKQRFVINIKKNIPHGAGLGGGSSNAATLLNFFCSKGYLNVKEKIMYEIANKIGFDTPISLSERNTLFIGKNRKIIRINRRFGFDILIVYPNIVCSTKKIYKKLSIKDKKFTFDYNKIKLNSIKRKKLIDFLRNENNDLEETVVKYHPTVKKITDLIKFQKGCNFSRITGSGSACIGIFSSKENAIYTQKLIKLKYPNYWCVVSKTI